jgi:hypothetical protein
MNYKFWLSMPLLAVTFGLASNLTNSVQAETVPTTTQTLNDIGQVASLGAEPQAIAGDSQDQRLDQLNSVFMLRDVAPSDWAFDALRNLVEKYNSPIQV